MSQDDNNQSEVASENLTVSRSDDLDTALDKALSGEKPAVEKPEEQPRIEAPVVVEELPEPPAEFSKKGRDAWEKGDRKGIREEWDRVNSGRLSELHKGQTETRTYRELAQKINPYIEASALRGKSPEVAMMEALALYNEMQKDPFKVAREVAKIRGLTEPTGEEKESSAQESALQKRIEALESERESEKASRQEEQRMQSVSQWSSHYQALLDEKHEGGQLKFPDLGNGDLAASVGSLIRSEDFVRTVSARIPNAQPRDLILQAYKAVGGLVSEDTQIKSQAKDTHSEKARKASISQPARSVPGNKSASTTYKDLDKALEAAFKAHS